MEVSLEDKQVMVCGSERDGDMSAQMEDVHNTNNDVSCVSCHCHIILQHRTILPPLQKES